MRGGYTTPAGKPVLQQQRVCHTPPRVMRNAYTYGPVRLSGGAPYGFIRVPVRVIRVLVPPRTAYPVRVIRVPFCLHFAAEGLQKYAKGYLKVPSEEGPEGSRNDILYPPVSKITISDDFESCEFDGKQCKNHTLHVKPVTHHTKIVKDRGSLTSWPIHEKSCSNM